MVADEDTSYALLDDGTVWAWGRGYERQLGVAGPELWDFNAILIALRGYTPAPGTSMTVDVARSRFMWRTQFTAAAAPEHIVTELGELPAIRLMATSATRTTPVPPHPPKTVLLRHPPA